MNGPTCLLWIQQRPLETQHLWISFSYNGVNIPFHSIPLTQSRHNSPGAVKMLASYIRGVTFSWTDIACLGVPSMLLSRFCGAWDVEHGPECDLERTVVATSRRADFFAVARMSVVVGEPTLPLGSGSVLRFVGGTSFNTCTTRL